MTRIPNGLAAAAVAALLCACGGGAQDAGTGGAQAAAVLPAGFKVLGYMPSWSGDVNQIQYDKLTHIHYAFVLPTAGGALGPVDNPGKLQALVSLAHARGVKVLISVGGWNNGDDSAFEALAASQTGIDAFTSSALDLVAAYGLDGVDVDWEYPDAGASSQRFGNLMRTLCGALHQGGRLCSAAVVSNGWNADAIPADSFGTVDYLMLMAYDGGDGAAHSPYSLAVTSLDYWLGRGLPRAKAVLGVPFYGRPSWQTYAQIVARDPQAPYKDESGGVYYNGIATIKAKTQLAVERGGGVGIWELSQDTQDATSLLRAIDEQKRSNGTTPGGIDPSALYEVRNVNSGKCVDASWAGTADGTVVLQYQCTGGANQQWRFQPTDSGYYNVVPSYASWLTWDVNGGPGATGDAAMIQLWGFSSPGGTNQQWRPEAVGDGVYRFVARHSGRCLDVPYSSTDDNVQLWQWGCNNTNAQAFVVTLR